MLKKVDVGLLRLGMYIHKIDESWMKHSFWASSFRLDDPKDLARLKSSSLHQVWIDTSKGLDVEEDVHAVEPEPEPETPPELVITPNIPLNKVTPVSFEDELASARKIQAHATSEVMSMFNDVRMGKVLETERAMDLVEDINQSIERNAGALISLVRLKNKDDYTYMHSVAVSALMIALGRQQSMDGDILRDVGMAGLLHDVGKIGIPHEILDKPSKLTDDEFSVMRQHPLLGHDFLQNAPGIPEAALDVCLHHHERIDGKGYPFNLSGDALTLYARMGSVCDVYDAITSDRCYKRPWGPAEAIHKMAEWQIGRFDDRVFKFFVKTIGIYPSGAIVKLRSGRIAAVVEQNSTSLLMPKVVLLPFEQGSGIARAVIDLAQENDPIVGAADPAGWLAEVDSLLMHG